MRGRRMVRISSVLQSWDSNNYLGPQATGMLEPVVSFTPTKNIPGIWYSHGTFFYYCSCFSDKYSCNDAVLGRLPSSLDRRIRSFDPIRHIHCRMDHFPRLVSWFQSADLTSYAKIGNKDRVEHILIVNTRQSYFHDQTDTWWPLFRPLFLVSSK